MYYDKGPQLTAGKLKEYLACIPDDVKICIGIGNEVEELHYLLNQDGDLVLHPDCYMQNASEVNIKTILSFNKRKEETI